MPTDCPVTVLMPVYNAARYLREALESILCQTYDRFELLIINDGSTDETVDIINSYRDERIHLVHNDRNRGLIATLNSGLTLAKGSYIARMDADDIAAPGRIGAQVAFMDAHPDVGVCGTWFQFMGTNSIIRHPVGHDAIKIKLLTDTAFAHPTVMLRRSALAETMVAYDSAYQHAEDYELWTRLVTVTRAANIARVLLQYRLHDSQISTSFAAQQKAVTNRIRLQQLDALGIEPDDYEKRLHLALLLHENIDNCLAGMKWLLKLRAANKKMSIYNDGLFTRQLLVWMYKSLTRKARSLLVQ